MTRTWIVVGALVLSACSGSSSSSSTETPATTESPATAERATPTTVETRTFPPAPAVPDGPNDEATARFDTIIDTLPGGLFSITDLEAFIEVADVRHAWLVSDLLRFIQPGPEADEMIAGFTTLTGVDVSEAVADDRSPWNTVTNHLLAWDTPAPPDYQRLKGALFTLAEDGWSPFFDDTDAAIDFRWLSWGGVFIDDRPLGDTEPCGGRGCIPALDDPGLVPASEGDWYDDEAIVFGVTEGDEAVAFPKHIMEVHEMVNITIGDRRFGIPYCTLCGSAHAFYTDDVPDGIDTPVLRTSGLLSRSNKVMYDLATSSAFDTFTGDAVSGPLRETGVSLPQNSVTVSTWGEWKAAHPNTTIVAEDGGIGRTYDDDPLGGRDDDGPIFPIGNVDPRLTVQAPVIGVVLDDGTTIAFEVAALDEATAAGPDATVEFSGVSVSADGGGYVAATGADPLGVHQAFWFAWSQFHPDTLLWPNDS